MKLGLVINPVAGVGAALAWKGTDDVARAWGAIEEGKPQPVWDIAQRAVSSISSLSPVWYLGGDYPILGLQGTVVYDLPVPSGAIHTREAVRALEKQGIDLLIFVGGDGTAADVATAQTSIPIIGVPGGVKIFSPCFLHRPEDLGSFLSNWEKETIEVDILDLNEELYRQGIAKPKLVTSAIIPQSSAIQKGKISWSTSDVATFELIGERIQEEGLLTGTILVGTGSTMKNILKYFGLEISLLGVDIIIDGKLEAVDCTASDLAKYDVDEVWLSPLGNQGHILGRGNRQISTDILWDVRKENIRIFATMEKIRQTPTLYVDTGDPKLDEALQGYYSVIVGYHEEMIRKAL